MHMVILMNFNGFPVHCLGLVSYIYIYTYIITPDRHSIHVWHIFTLTFTIKDQPHVAKYMSPMETTGCAVCVASRCHIATVRGHDGIKVVDPTLWRFGHVWISTKILGICVFGGDQS